MGQVGVKMSNKARARREGPNTVYNVAREHHLRPKLNADGSVQLDADGNLVITEPAFITWNTVLIIVPPFGKSTTAVVDSNGEYVRELKHSEARKIVRNHIGLSLTPPLNADVVSPPAPKKSVKAPKVKLDETQTDEEPVEEEAQHDS